MLVLFPEVDVDDSIVVFNLKIILIITERYTRNRVGSRAGATAVILAYPVAESFILRICLINADFQIFAIEYRNNTAMVILVIIRARGMTVSCADINKRIQPVYVAHKLEPDAIGTGLRDGAQGVAFSGLNGGRLGVILLGNNDDASRTRFFYQLQRISRSLGHDTPFYVRIWSRKARRAPVGDNPFLGCFVGAIGPIIAQALSRASGIGGTPRIYLDRAHISNIG